MKKKGIMIAIIIIIILAITLTVYREMTSNENDSSSEGSETATIYYAEDGPVEPSITVWTEIPDGEVEDGRFDITYTATPGRGAAVRKIYYVLNGDVESRLYTYGDPDIKLSEGTILLVPDTKNKIVFYVEDSNGKIAEFAAENQPYYAFPDSPSYDESQLRPSRQGEDRQYVMDRLILDVEDDISDEEVMEMIEDIGGEIIGDLSIIDRYYIQVPESTEAELEDMCEQLESKYEEQIENVKLYYVGGLTLYQTDDPWWSETPVSNEVNGLDEYKQRTSLGLYDTAPEYYEWNLPYRQWGLDAINAPEAWKLLPDKIDNIKIGVLDDGFMIGHEDLKELDVKLRYENVNEETEKAFLNQIHGTHVMGTIAAIHNNRTGITGVVDLEPGMMYGADVSPEGVIDEEEVIWGIRWLVEQGVRVINISLGSEFETNTPKYEEMLTDLRDKGRDFLIVAAAGNAFKHPGNAFVKFKDIDIRNRTIVVGAVTPPYDPRDPGKYNMASFTNYGPDIDVVAPGVRIYSTTAASYYPYYDDEGVIIDTPEYGDGYYFMLDGTSMAAPHVTGIAAMVWSANPNLTGAEVRNIIMQSGTAVIEDNRESMNIDVADYQYPLADAEAAVKMSTDIPIPQITEYSTQTKGFIHVFNTYTIKWEITGPNTDDVTGYEIYRSKELTGPYILVGTTDTDKPEFTETVEGWFSDPDYYYQVKSVTAEERSASSETVWMHKGASFFRQILDTGMGNAVAYGKDALGIAADTVSPLLIDLDGAGIETLPLSQGIYFNHQGSSFRIRTGWAGPSEGILARDLDGDGRISNGRELFGNNTLLRDGQDAANGFEALRDLDDSGDGIFDARDALFGSLLIWQDADSNGRSAPGELATLEEAGILSVDLAYTETDIQDVHGNIHRQVSTVTKTDQTTADVADIWFVRDLADSDAEEQLDVSAAVAALPDIRGFGSVYSLHQALMRDDSGSLKSLLERFIAEQDETARRNLMPQILYQWTGTDSSLKVLEAFIGEKYTGGTGSNAMAVITQGYSHISNTVYQILMAQTHYRFLYEAAVPAGADPEDMTLDFSGVAAILLERIAADRDSGESLLVNFVINIHTLSMSGYIAPDSFRDVLAEANSTYGYLADMGRQNIFIGTVGDDTVTGTSAADAYWYEHGTNVIRDSGGSDTYFFGNWFGDNTVIDKGGDNRILFLSGIRQEDVEAGWIEGTASISIRTAAGQGKLTVSSGPSYELVFMDGTVSNLYDLVEYEDISTPEQLALIRQDLAGIYRLTEDIDMEGIEWVPIGTMRKPFKGVFYGNGHTVSNLTVDLPAGEAVGFFGTNDGVITGLSLDNVQISGRNFTGGLAGINYGSIMSCHIDGSVTGNDDTGGLAGYNDGSIDACTVEGYVTGSNDDAGGLVGHNDGSIKASSVEGYVSGGSSVGGLVGSSYGSIEGCAVTGGLITGKGSSIGGLAGTLGEGEIRNSYAAVNVSGTQYAGGLAGSAYDMLLEQCYASGHVKGTSAGGFIGCVDGAVIVRNSFARGNVSLGSNTAGFVGHTASSYAPDLRIENSYSLSSNPNGFSLIAGTMTACYFDKDLAGTAAQPEGRTTDEMKRQSTYTGWDFDSVWMTGEEGYPVLQGLPQPARSYTEISTPEELENIRQNLGGSYRLTADLDLSGHEWIPLGGSQNPFYGMLDGNGHTIRNLTVALPDQDHVGLFGYNKGKITGLSLEGIQVTGRNQTGGLAGYSAGDIEACTVEGVVTGSLATGGLTGHNSGIIETCSVDVAVTGTSDTGGLTGHSTGMIGGSTVAGTLVTGSRHTGGLIGYMQGGEVRNSYAAVNVAGSYVGGLAGYVSGGLFEQCYATGHVTDGITAGGFAGYLTSTVTVKNCFSTGNVSAKKSSAGFVGYIKIENTAQIENCYSLSDNPSGFSGSAGIILNCYFDTDLAGEAGGQAEGRTTEEMKRQSTYTDAGWDFEDIWEIKENSYPTLRGMGDTVRFPESAGDGQTGDQDDTVGGEEAGGQDETAGDGQTGGQDETAGDGQTGGQDETVDGEEDGGQNNTAGGEDQKEGDDPGKTDEKPDGKDPEEEEGSSGGEEPADPGNTEDTYDPGRIYVAGDTAVYNGVTYKAKWWIQGGGAPDVNQAWEKASGGNTDSGVSGSYNPQTAYTGGNRVTYEGHVYQAKWWTKGDVPGKSDVWQLIE